MLVQAECLQKAWDSKDAFMYEPGGGPLPGGLYEIDTDNKALVSLTAAGKWLFQYAGHEGKADASASAVVPVAVQTVAPQVDSRRKPMSADRKAKLKASLAAARAAKRARLEAAAA